LTRASIKEKSVTCFSYALTGAVIVYCAAVFLPPVLKGNSGSAFSLFLLHEFYHKACHQLPAKTISIFGAPLLVCARCTGIYAGMLLVLLSGFIFKFRRIPILFIFILCFPMFLDILRLNLQIAAYYKSIALLSGFLAGIAGGDLYLTFFFSINSRKHEK
jgi:uncharacterized membrane protein